MARYLISGGGTGGHIFPAIAIAEALKARDAKAEFLFVGAKGRMEMTKVPDAGYPITGLWISGFSRSLSLKNLAFPFKVINSLVNARRIVRKFKPDVAIGTGGYASGPTLFAASGKGIPCLIQEQNAFPGVTNKILAKRVAKICVAYQGMEKYFPKEKIVITGNPIRKELQKPFENKLEALHFFGFEDNKPTILIVGGSQGSMAINNAFGKIINNVAEKAQVIWQTGITGYDNAVETVKKNIIENVGVHKFIKRMDLAYAAADIIISRAGAIAISEIAVAGKCTIFIPLPSAAEDHQTKNALTLVEKEAAISIPQQKIDDKLRETISELLENPQIVSHTGNNIRALAQADAAEKIAENVIHLIHSKR